MENGKDQIFAYKIAIIQYLNNLERPHPFCLQKLMQFWICSNESSNERIIPFLCWYSQNCLFWKHELLNLMIRIFDHPWKIIINSWTFSCVKNSTVAQTVLNYLGSGWWSLDSLRVMKTCLRDHWRDPPPWNAQKGLLALKSLKTGHHSWCCRCF